MLLYRPGGQCIFLSVTCCFWVNTSEDVEKNHSKVKENTRLFLGLNKNL